MSRYSFPALAVTFFLALGTFQGAVAQVPRNSPSAASKFLVIPGLAPLSMEGVQREIGLTPDQKQQLKAVSAAYLASKLQLDKSFGELSPDEQQNQGKRFGEQAAQMVRITQRKAQAILTPQQFQAVEKIAFQLSAAGALADPALQDKIGLSPEQRQRLNAVYDQAAEKMQRLQRDTAAQAMQLLDEDQAAELKKQIDTPKPR